MSSPELSLANLFPAADAQEWRARVDAVLKGASFDKKLVNRTHDGLRIEPLYARRSDTGLVKGVRAGQPWRVCARMDHPDSDMASRQARDDLEGGADSLSLVFHGSLSARGYGLPRETVADLDAALAGVHLDLIAMRLDPAPAGRIQALSIAALVERRKLNPAQVQLDFGMDPIGSLLLHGKVPWDWSTMATRLGETVSTLSQRGFKGPFLAVDMRPWHEAGASEGQELATALAQAVQYLRALETAGLTLEEAQSALSFIVPLDGDQLLGMAKLRSLRILWDRVSLTCGLTPRPITIHAETSWRMLTRRDAYVNILRASVASFAAAVGGADSITVLPYTQCLGLPEAEARRLARNTSIVMLEESNLWRVADPAAGAGGYEALTEDLCARAWQLFQEIEAEGGLVASLTKGAVQGRIMAVRDARMRAVATRKEPLTGTSEFANLSDVPPKVLDVARPAARKFRAIAPNSERPKFPLTTAEIISALQAGETQSAVVPSPAGSLKALPLVSRRLAEPFEALRDRADAMMTASGKRPAVILLTIGALADHAARLAFTRTFFEVGGFEVIVVSALPTELKNGLVCLVGTDGAYAADGVDLIAPLVAAGMTVWMAGRPGDQEDAFSKAGISRFVFAGCDVVEILTEAQDVTNS